MFSLYFYLYHLIYAEVIFGMVGLFASCFRFPLTPVVIVAGRRVGMGWLRPPGIFSAFSRGWMDK